MAECTILESKQNNTSEHVQVHTCRVSERLCGFMLMNETVSTWFDFVIYDWSCHKMSLWHICTYIFINYLHWIWFIYFGFGHHFLPPLQIITDGIRKIYIFIYEFHKHLHSHVRQIVKLFGLHENINNVTNISINQPYFCNILANIFVLCEAFVIRLGFQTTFHCNKLNVNRKILFFQFEFNLGNNLNILNYYRFITIKISRTFQYEQ